MIVSLEEFEKRRADTLQALKELEKVIEEYNSEKEQQTTRKEG